MAGFSRQERQDAARTEQACRQRLAEIEQAFARPHSSEENRALNVEAQRVLSGLQYALFVLTDEAGA
ncbi:hypothetical protein OHV08_33990 [Streptomyces canus]|uniref:hypothetical protein n=1 Tax=Streptomyces canus TaxID=58343 RepID=UPI0032464F8A